MKFFGKTFTREAPQPQPPAPAFQRSHGSTLDEMIENEIKIMRRESRPVVQPAANNEPPIGVVIARMVHAELPAAARDARALQAVKAENAKRELEDSRAMARELAENPSPAADSDYYDYELSDPNF